MFSRSVRLASAMLSKGRSDTSLRSEVLLDMVDIERPTLRLFL